MKTTQQVADRLVELCRASNYDAAYSELYHDDIVSIEQPDADEPKITRGIQAILAKGDIRNDQMEKFISGRTGDAQVAGDYITLTMGFTCIYKGHTEETSESEVCVYRVQDGKIISEMFYY